MDNEKDHLSIYIEEKLDKVPTQLSDSFIAKVPQHLRNVNEKAFEPQLVAIGPYHRHQTHLKVMEEHKLWYLKLFLKRRKEKDLTRYVKAMRELEKTARACYVEIAYLEEDEFVEILILDACFIVQLFRRNKILTLDDSDPELLNDRVFSTGWIMKKLGRDLLLVENQLPFFVLLKFFDMTAMPKEDFYEMMFSFFQPLLPNPRYKPRIKSSFHKIKHVLSFVHDHWVSSIKTTKSDSEGKRVNWWKFKMCKITRRVRPQSSDGGYHIRDVMRCATELREAGIKFTCIKGNDLFDVKFKNGIMKIPTLKIEDDTESLFRNLIVYEQFYPKESVPILDYVKFMDCLINSAKDVELLCQRKILHNYLGDDKVVANLFNRLGDSLRFPDNSHYGKIIRDVDKHCSRPQKTWMANLRHNYCNSPWATASVFAAILLLVLTLAQTVFSFLSYFQ